MPSEGVSDPSGAYLVDLETLTSTELRLKYQLTYNSWRNGKRRASPSGNWAEEFTEFRSFLRSMGPRPGPNYTLDRIDNGNPRYGQELCRWADKGAQANNRRSTLKAYSEGQIQPLSEIARANEQHPASARKRVERGWSEEEAVAGERWSEDSVFGKDPRTYRPWPKPNDFHAQFKWEQLYREAGGLKRFTRYTFLIQTLRREMAKLRKWFAENEPDPFELTSVEYGRHISHYRRVLDVLHTAERELPAWERAVKAFEARRAESSALRGDRYLDYPQRSIEPDFDD